MRKYEIAVISKGAFARTVRIFSPKRADRALVIHDGQNVFSDAEATFGKSLRALELLKSAKAKNVAVVAIDAAPSRNDDYLPFPADGMGGGKADTYAEYISDMLVPYIQKRFGIKYFAMLGSSAGALFTLYYAARRDARFRAYGIFSAPLFVSPELDGFVETAEFDATARYFVYAGAKECADGVERGSEFVTSANTVAERLKDIGAHIDITVDENGEHDETFWRAPAAKLIADFAKLNFR